MREIKFRAWNKKYEMMDSDFYIHSNGSQYDLAERNYNTPHIEIEHAELELMQFTGLKDKNGVEIYEGDIVSTCLSDIKGEARWGRIIMKNPFEYSTEEALYIIHADELEIIGNIYENPELLNG